MDPEPGEEVFFQGHPSWWSMGGLLLRGLLVSLAVGVAAGIASAVADGRVQVLWVVGAVLACALAMLGQGQLHRLQTTYSITDRRLTIETGLLSRDLHQTRLDRVQNVRARQSVAQRLLGIGTVDFDTAGEMGFDFSFRGVEDPGGIVSTVDRAIQRRHEARRAGMVDV